MIAKQFLPNFNCQINVISPFYFCIIACYFEAIHIRTNIFTLIKYIVIFQPQCLMCYISNYSAHIERIEKASII